MRSSHFANVVGTGDWSADILVRLCVRVSPKTHRRTFLSNAARNWPLVWRVTCTELLAAWKRREVSSPSPRPSPQGRGRGQARLSHIGRTRRFVARPAWLPLLWGEGWGEGERGRRTDVAAQNVFGPRETEPQFLAALDKIVRTAITQAGRGGDSGCHTPGGNLKA